MTDKEQPDQNCCEWMKNNSLEIVLGIIALVIIPLAAGQWWDCLVGEAENGAAGSGYAIRTLVFIYGALGAFYGVILNARRLKISEAGLFDERFGRGVELLNNDGAYIRVAGVRILEDSHKTAEPADKKLIYKLLIDFIHSRAGIYYSEKPEPKPREERVDIEVAIKALGKLVSG